jgi:DNA gyrase subunit A
MDLERPDLSDVDDEVVEYIEALEAELLRWQANSVQPGRAAGALNVITITKSGLAKRTPRHWYGRQRRAGMGVFGLDTNEDDPPAHLLVADESGAVVLFTNLGRAFRLPVREIVETAVAGRGQSLLGLLPFRLQTGETIACAVPSEGGAFLALLSERGWVRRIRSAYLGERMIPGMSFHDVKEGGFLAAACWTPGNGDLFLATVQGNGVRFSEQQVPNTGVRGMRVEPTDKAMAITAVKADSGVFMLTADGKGTIREMAGFAANKAPGAGGKVAMKTEMLVGAVTVQEQDDIFIISRLGKVIRFQAAEIPAKEGVVQGVHCMNLRADETAALANGNG